MTLLPFVPILPGLGSLAALLLGLVSYGKKIARRRWIAAVAVAVGGLGVMLAVIQLFAAFLYPFVGPMR